MLSVGSLVYYEHLEEPGKGLWSAIAGRREWINDEERVYITFDGCLVPATHSCGIQGPDPSKNWLLVPFNQHLRYRQSEPTDGKRQVSWDRTVAAYKTKTGHYEAAKKRFTDAKPGTPVAWTTNETSGSWSMPAMSVKHGKGALVKLYLDVEPGYATVDTRGMDGIIHVKLEDIFII